MGRHARTAVTAAHRRTGRARAAAALAVALALAVAASACSSDDGDDGGGAGPAGGGTPATSSAPSATLAPPEGLPAFYGVPDPLPEGEPGDLLAADLVEAPSIQGRTWRVMYLSESVQGEPIAVTGLVAVPEAPAPEGGYPVVSWAHGTTGIADECAPSLEADELARLANPLLERGYAVVATDYEGMATPGRHPYIVGDSEARGAIDIVRAARQLGDLEGTDLQVEGAELSDRYLVWGHSQGGHAATFALDIADDWAPELDLVGVVAGAPPSQLLLLNSALQQSPFKHYIAMVAAAFNAAYGDDEAPLDQVLTPEGIEFLDNVDTGCADDLGDAAADLDFATLQLADPATVPAWAELLADNDPGRFTEPSEAPLLIVHGGVDEQIPVASSAILFDQLCAIGQVTQRWVYPDQTHAGVILPSSGDMLRWIDDRFAGQPAPDPYVPVGPPVPTAQSCPPTG